MGLKPTLAVVAAFCSAIQFLSATWFVPTFETPNLGTVIATSLVQTGRYQGGRWRPEAQPRWRAWQASPGFWFSPMFTR